MLTIVGRHGQPHEETVMMKRKDGVDVDDRG
jgi:hypothetical protein